MDLGLPSGTKWADRNMEASSQTAVGGYYAFGETSEKQVYDQSTYTFKADMSDVAGTEYDAATKKYGEGWSIPTPEQWQELIANCTQEVTIVNKQLGIKFIGKNNNSIFVPGPYPYFKFGTKEKTAIANKDIKESNANKVKNDVEKLKLLGMTAKWFYAIYRTSNKDKSLCSRGMITIARNGVIKERLKEVLIENTEFPPMVGFPIRPVFCGKTTSTTTSSSNTDNSGDGNFVIY